MNIREGAQPHQRQKPVSREGFQWGHCMFTQFEIIKWYVILVTILDFDFEKDQIIVKLTKVKKWRLPLPMRMELQGWIYLPTWNNDKIWQNISNSCRNTGSQAIKEHDLWEMRSKGREPSVTPAESHERVSRLWHRAGNEAEPTLALIWGNGARPWKTKVVGVCRTGEEICSELGLFCVT